MADDTLELSADLFSPLTNELRVRIVVALGRHQAEHPDDRSLSFNELRDRVGGPDSGQFNYHLEQLQGPYVWHADGEYGLTLAGERVVGAIRSGTNDVDAERGPFDIDATDPLTGEPLAVEWRNGFLVVRGVEEPVRDAGFLYREAVPPGMLSERDVESALAFSFRVSNNRYSMFMSGVCPLCYGPADRRIEPATAGDGTGRRFRGVCTRCGHRKRGPLGVRVVHEPVVVSFFHDHGTGVRTEPYWDLEFLWDDAVLEEGAGSSAAYRLTVEAGEDRLALTVDGSGQLIESSDAGADADP